MDDHKALGKKAAILQAAARIFSEKGFHQAKIEDIAQAAEVGKGTIYEYFPSKEKLFTEMFRLGMESYQAQLQEEVVGAQTLAEKLLSIYRVLVSFIHRYRHMATIILNDNLGISGETRQWILAEKHRKQEFTVNLLRQAMEAGEIKAVNVDLVAQMFAGAVHLASLNAAFHHSPEEFEAIGREFVRLFLEGVGA